MSGKFEQGKATRATNRRAFRMIVWIGRAIGGILIALAILSIPGIKALTGLAGGFKLVSSLALGLLGIAWVVGLELLLHFFDQYLSRN
jgi:hypothetical protein